MACPDYGLATGRLTLRMWLPGASVSLHVEDHHVVCRGVASVAATAWMGTSRGGREALPGDMSFQSQR